MEGERELDRSGRERNWLRKQIKGVLYLHQPHTRKANVMASKQRLVK